MKKKTPQPQRPSLILENLRRHPTVEALQYINAAPRGRGAQPAWLPIHAADASALPDDIDAIVFTSDLQGRHVDPATGSLELLGRGLARYLRAAADADALPPAGRIGVVLCGDLYALPGAQKRGGIGDVVEVWRAFAREFAWVVGVAGNHDSFGPRHVDGLGSDARRLIEGAGGTLLHGDCVDVGPPRRPWVIGGVGGILGRPGKPNRSSPDAFEDHLVNALADEPTALLLHEPPDLRRGNAIRDALRVVERPTLVAFGHRDVQPILQRWPDPERGPLQLLSLDHRVVIATRSRP